MPTIQEVRQRYPQYSDMSDAALGDALHSKFYSDMPKSEFNAKIGLEQPNQALDIGKGLAVGGVKAIENAPATIPLLTGLAGKGAQYLLDKFAPGTTDPLQQENQAKMLELAQQARGGGVAGMLPQPQTPTGQAASYGAQYALPAAGLAGGVVRNMVGGAAGGVGAYGAGKLAPNEEQKPYYELAGGLLGGTTGLKAADRVGQPIARALQPSAAAIESNASAGYNALRDELRTPLNDKVLGLAGDKSAAALIERGLGPGPKEATGITKNIADLQKAKPEVASLYDYRQALKAHYQVADTPQGKELSSALGGNPAAIGLNKAGAYQAQPVVEALLEREAPGTMGKLNQLDRDFAISKASGSLDKRLAQTEATSGNTTVGEAMKKRVGAFLASNDARYLTDADKKLMADAIKPSLTQKALNAVATVTGSGGGGPLGKLAGTLVPGAGVYGSYATGDPTYAAIGLGGHGAKIIANQLMAGNANHASALLRSQSSLGQKALMGVNPRLKNRDAALIAALLASQGQSDHRR